MADLLNSIIPNVMSKPDLLWKAFVETMQMLAVSAPISFLLGLILGVAVVATKSGGVLENRLVNLEVGKVIDLFRSIPFILLAIIMLGLSRLVIGTASGVKGAIIPLLFGTVPFFARQVEAAMSEVPPGLVEAASSMGCSPWDILWRVYLKESIPGIVRGGTITLVSLIGFTAMAGAIGAGGLGNFAITYGLRRQMDVAYVVIAIILVMVSLIQMVGTRIAEKATH